MGSRPPDHLYYFVCVLDAKCNIVILNARFCGVLYSVDIRLYISWGGAIMGNLSITFTMGFFCETIVVYHVGGSTVAPIAVQCPHVLIV